MSMFNVYPDEYFEPADLIEIDDETARPVEMLHVGAGFGWWSASPIDSADLD